MTWPLSQIATVIAVGVLVEAFLICLYVVLWKREKQRRREWYARRIEKRHPHKPITLNLEGEPCTHTFDARWRGYLMCTQPMCAALCNMDGTALTKSENRALKDQMDEEMGW